MDKRKNRKGKVEYLVRWRGYGSEGDTWEPEGNLSTCTMYVHDFNRQHAEHQRENLLLRSTRRSPNHQAQRQPCPLLLASTAGAHLAADVSKGAAVASEQVEAALGRTQPVLPGPAALSSQHSVGGASSLMPAPPCGSARRSMDLSKMGIKILVPKSPMNSRPDSEESPSEAGVQEAHLVPPEVALPEKPAGVQLGPGEERARMGSRPRNPNPLSSTAAARPPGCPGESLWSCDWVGPVVARILLCCLGEAVLSPPAGNSASLEAIPSNGTTAMQSTVAGATGATTKRRLEDRGAFDKRLRFSVRQTESAYRYRDIVVKKQDGFTHILLSSKSSENNTLNPEVRPRPSGTSLPVWDCRHTDSLVSLRRS